VVLVVLFSAVFLVLIVVVEFSTILLVAFVLLFPVLDVDDAGVCAYALLLPTTCCDVFPISMADANSIVIAEESKIDSIIVLLPLSFALELAIFDRDVFCIPLLSGLKCNL
jgi:hypothetical protein